MLQLLNCLILFYQRHFSHNYFHYSDKLRNYIHWFSAKTLSVFPLINDIINFLKQHRGRLLEGGV